MLTLKVLIGDARHHAATERCSGAHLTVAEADDFAYAFFYQATEVGIEECNRAIVATGGNAELRK